MYLLTGFHPFEGEDMRYFSDNEKDTAFAIANRWYALRRYPKMYHYKDGGVSIVFNWRDRAVKKAA